MVNNFVTNSQFSIVMKFVNVNTLCHNEHVLSYYLSLTEILSINISVQITLSPALHHQNSHRISIQIDNGKYFNAFSIQFTCITSIDVTTTQLRHVCTKTILLPFTFMCASAVNWTDLLCSCPRAIIQNVFRAIVIVLRRNSYSLQ